MSGNCDMVVSAADPLSVVVDPRCSAWMSLVPNATERCRSAAAAAFGAAGVLSAHAEVSVVLADDIFIQSLNKDWRQQDKPTNVLAFPGDAPSAPGDEVRLLGDIVVASGVVQREALDEGRPIGDHLAHMVVHGTLHLLGYDHLAEDEAVQMEELETKALAELGIDDPYSTDRI